MIGFYNIIKPTGVSSGLIVNKIKRLTKEKVGHLGTLDPAASGVLPIAVGKATRFFDYFLNKDKEYIALAKFGVETDTLDSEGEILKRKRVKNLSLEDVQKSADIIKQKNDQMPPLYSSKSVNGIRAYDAARRNIEIELKPKKVQIYDIFVEKTDMKDLFKLKIHCSSGTYVRSIVRDIAYNLGLVATTVCIIRTGSGKFRIENAQTYESIECAKETSLIRINDVLRMKEIKLNQSQAKALSDGKTIEYLAEDGEYLCFYNNEEFSVVDCLNNKIKSKIYLYSKEKVW